MSELHEMLKEKTVNGIHGTISLYAKFADIKENSKAWLSNLEKNGFNHSCRLEKYLDKLTEKERTRKDLSENEAFILLCAVFMHDIGYWDDGRCNPVDHPNRSQKLLLANPKNYLLDDFFFSPGHHPRIVEAIGWVCLGHSEEKFVALERIPSDFCDQSLGEDSINLRKLSAYLRLADESDDPYIRLEGLYHHPIREDIPLVEIKNDVIVWHWNRDGENNDQVPFVKHLKEKKDILFSSLQYLSQLRIGYWYLELFPYIQDLCLYMPEMPVRYFTGRLEDVEKIHDIIKSRGEGNITGIIGTGGMGKTALAKFYAQKYRKEYPGGIFWASFKNSTWIEEAKKIIVCIKPEIDSEIVTDEKLAKEHIEELLKRENALLILDNVDKPDHLINPQCHILVTSRNKDIFGILPSESLYRLSGLSDDEGKELLNTLLDPIRVNADIRGALRLIRTLGGMPLALEIASKHLADCPDLTFIDYINYVEEKLSTLTLEDDMNKNVIAVLELSLDQLKNDEDGNLLLNLFYASGICASSGFTSMTLGAVAGLKNKHGLSLNRFVGKLHNRSIFEFNQATRHYYDHPLLYQLAKEFLDQNSEKKKIFLKNYNEYFLNYALNNNHNYFNIIAEKDGLWQSMVYANQEDNSGNFSRKIVSLIANPYREFLKQKNYICALHFLADTNLYKIDQLGQIKYLNDLLTPLLEQKNNLDLQSRGWLLRISGLTHANFENYIYAIDLVKESIDIYKIIGDELGEAFNLNTLGNIYFNLEKIDDAIISYERAIDIHRKYNKKSGYLICNLSAAYAIKEEFDKSIFLLKEALEIARTERHVSLEESILGNLGAIYHKMKDYSNGLYYFKEAYTIAFKIGDLDGQGKACYNIGHSYYFLRDKENALVNFRQALEIFNGISKQQMIKQVNYMIKFTEEKL